tara:strand:+ start:185 stop:412 length:228 start_codon:yes stop_codon:yes gene_type:complete
MSNRIKYLRDLTEKLLCGENKCPKPFITFDAITKKVLCEDVKASIKKVVSENIESSLSEACEKSATEVEELVDGK